MRRLLFLVAALLLARPALAAPDVRLYAMDCGAIAMTDADAYTDDGAYKGQARALTVPCYLIRHPKGDLLWETGLPQTLADKPAPPGTEVASVKVKLTDQLKTLGLEPGDIEFLSVSHSHYDHLGNGGLFVGSTWIVDARERAYAFRPAARRWPEEFKPYAALENAKTVQIEGDASFDVFGDGSVTIIAAPGHTPGHRVLLVRLAEAGPVLLTGDMWHFAESRPARRVPRFNTDRAATLHSMDVVEALARDTKARVVIEHAPSDFEALPRFPQALR